MEKIFSLNDKIIVPFGEECYTAQSIDSKFSENKFRKCAFPFDYVGHTYIECIYDNLVDLLNLNKKICINDFSLEMFNDKYFMCHKKYGFKYWHDIQKHDNKIDTEDNEIKTFFEKYNRRYERLKNSLKNDKIIILCVNHFDNIFTKKTNNGKQNTIYNLFNLLKSYNDNVEFIAVNFGEDLYNIQNLLFVNLPINYNLSFIESKQCFTKQLYNFVKSSF